MKLKSKKLIFIVLASFFIIFCMSNNSFAGYQTLNSLDFQIDIKENGDMRIIETWDVDLEDTNTLFKTFPIDEGHSGIKDVSVVEIENTGKVEFKESTEYEYHVEEDYFQALENPDGDFEIAWGVDAYDDYGRKFQISYTVLNHVFVYEDCSEVYWKLIGNDFEIFAEEITGTITIPDGITNAEALRVWAHGPLNGTITKDSNTEVSFKVEDLPVGTFLELRMAMPNDLFLFSNKKQSSSKLETILAEEKVFAEEANRKREEQLKFEENMRKISYVITAVGSLVCVWYFFKLSEYSKQEPKIVPEQKLDYFREAPDGQASAAEASFVYYTGNIGDIGKVISATMLNLSLKGWIKFEKDASNEKDMLIEIKNTGKELTADENAILKYLKEIATGKNYFTLEEFKKYNKKHQKEAYNLTQSIPSLAKKQNIAKGNFTEGQVIKAKYFIQMFLMIVGIFVSIFCMANIEAYGAILTALIVVDFVRWLMFISRFNGFTQKGINEKEMWKGLKKYMEDFSLLNEREVPELALWEKYLVYATAFGVADKVIKQLKVVFPEMSDEEYLRTNYTCMYFASNSDMKFANSISSSIGNAAGNYSSSTGAGGGFSSGGGGGFGGGGGGGR